MYRTFTTFSRSQLAEVPLWSVWPPRPGACLATMSAGHWDGLLAAAWTLLEVDDDERAARAYRQTPEMN